MHQAILARAPRNPRAPRGPRLRLIRSSSAPLPPSVMLELERQFGCPVIEAYGMTEAAHQMASNPLPPRTRKPGSVGLAAGPEVAVMDGRGPAAAGRRGGRGRDPRRQRHPRLREQPRGERARLHRDGWFRTGDQGVLDDDGYLTLTGRLKEIINRGGEKIVAARGRRRAAARTRRSPRR